eukprot:12288295-Alexandrium_andersonii.AAC.1
MAGSRELDLDAYGALDPQCCEDMARESQLADELRNLIHRHAFAPVGLGSARADLAHEAAALFHSMFLETGTPKRLASLLQSAVSVTSDKGTEAGFSKMPAVLFSEYFPYFAQFSFANDGAGTGADDSSDGGSDAGGDALAAVGEDYGDAPLHVHQAVQISGALHVLSNAVKSMLHAMPHYEEWIHPLLSALSDCLNASFTRDRFISQCLQGGPGEKFVFLFQSFPATLIKWRFGCLSKVVGGILDREVPLKRYWDLERLKFRNGPILAPDADAGGAAPP